MRAIGSEQAGQGRRGEEKIETRGIFLLPMGDASGRRGDMPRIARTVVAGVPHHVYQRALPGKKAFLTAQDYQTYLELLKEKAALHKVDILAYCLLPDGVHVVAVPHDKRGLAGTMSRTHFNYVQYLNRRRGRSGQLWRNRFLSCAVEKRALETVVQYVEWRPVGEGLARKAEKYAWSSAAAHAGGRDKSGVLARKVWPGKKKLARWGQRLGKPLDKKLQRQIRTRTQTGLPFGSAAFIKSLERKLRRVLHARPVGRPRVED